MCAIFWSDDQKKILSMLKDGASGVMVGDYGCGKTVIMTAMARHFDSQGRDVKYIVARGADILHLHLKAQLADTQVEVLKIEKDIKKYLEGNCDENTVVFIDECSLEKEKPLEGENRYS